MNLFDHQASAYQELLRRARTFFAGHWRGLAIGTRWHSMLVGPTGTGKTALGTLLAQDTDASLLRINATNWMPSGAHNRAVAETITMIIGHVQSYERTVLFVDEIDKLWHETPWNSYIRGELFELLDGRLATGAKGIGDNDSEEDDTLSQISSVSEKLRFATFFVGAGTFQDFYETRADSTQIGFHAGQICQSPSSGPTADVIAKKLPRELLNRFNSSLLFLPPLEPHHYKLIAQQAEQSLPEWIQPAFRKAATERIEQAIAARSGCRYVEEALAEALKSTPAPNLEPTAPEPDLCDW